MKTYLLQIMNGSDKCGCVTVNENGQTIHCDEWHNAPIGTFMDMVAKFSLWLIEEWTSSGGNRYLTFKDK